MSFALRTNFNEIFIVDSLMTFSEPNWNQSKSDGVKMAKQNLFSYAMVVALTTTCLIGCGENKNRKAEYKNQTNDAATEPATKAENVNPQITKICQDMPQTPACIVRESESLVVELQKNDELGTQNQHLDPLKTAIENVKEKMKSYDSESPQTLKSLGELHVILNGLVGFLNQKKTSAKKPEAIAKLITQGKSILSNVCGVQDSRQFIDSCKGTKVSATSTGKHLAAIIASL